MKTQAPTKAIFLDRDGTIILDKHYLHKPEEVEYFADTQDALRLMVRKNYLLFLVTNQSGVGRGWFSETDVVRVHQQIEADLKAWGLPTFERIEYCTAAPDTPHPRRKPNPGMITDILKHYPTLEPNQCYMVGDKVRDAEAGQRAGMHGALVYANQPNSGFASYNSLLEFAQMLP